MTKINSPGNKLDGWCVRMFLMPGDDLPRYNFMEPNGATRSYGSSGFHPNRYPNGYLAAVKQFADEGNEMIVWDYPDSPRGLGPWSIASFYTATLDDQGKVIEVDGSRAETFSEWNSMSLEERTKMTKKANERDSTFCDNQTRRLRPAFYANYEPCQF